MSRSEAAGGNVGGWRRAVPIALAVLMALVIGYGVFESPHAGAQAIPAPAQYTTNTTAANPFADPLVIAGVALGILVVVFALLLAFRLRGSRMSGGGSTEEETEDGDEGAESGEGKEGSEEEPEASDGGSPAEKDE